MGRKIALAIALLVAAIVIAAQFQGYICEAAKQGGPDQCSLHNGAALAFLYTRRYLDGDTVIALATCVIAVFTFSLWYSTNKLWREAESAGRTAKTSADAAAKAA